MKVRVRERSSRGFGGRHRLSRIYRGNKASRKLNRYGGALAKIWLTAWKRWFRMFWEYFEIRFHRVNYVSGRSWTGIDRFRAKFVHLLWKFDELINRKFVEYICWTKKVVWISVWRWKFVILGKVKDWKFVYNEFVCSRNNSYLVDEDNNFLDWKV